MHSSERVSIRFEQQDFLALSEWLLKDKTREQYAYLLCHTAKVEGGLIILPRKIVVSDKQGVRGKRSATAVRIDRDVANAIYRHFANSDYTAFINVHSHPNDARAVSFSKIDDRSDKVEARYIATHMPEMKRRCARNPDVAVLSMVIGLQCFAARQYDISSDRFTHVNAITIIGERVLQGFLHQDHGEHYDDDPLYARQVLAFGGDAQKMFKTVSAVIAGVGGLGSIMAEELLRLGCRELTLIDPDELSISNLNRWQGGATTDIGRMKVDICKRNLTRMFPDARIQAIAKTIYSKKAISAIKAAGCIIGCVDSVPARYFLNRLSLQYLIPYIDGGVVIKTETLKGVQKISSIEGRMGVVIPGATACMMCSGTEYFKLEEVNEYFLDAETREQRIRAGYIQNRPEEESPSVYPLNQSIASIMALEFMNIFSGFKKLNYNIYLDLMRPEKGFSALNNQDHYEGPGVKCLPCTTYRGAGDAESLRRFTDRNRVKIPTQPVLI